MFILCSYIDDTNFDENLLLSILSKFKLTSLVIRDGNRDEYIFIELLQMPSIQETLEHFRIKSSNIFSCTSVIELLVELKKIKKIRIEWGYYKNVEDNKVDEWKLKIEQFETKLKKKHSQIEIDIDIYYEETE